MHCRLAVTVLFNCLILASCHRQISQLANRHSLQAMRPDLSMLGLGKFRTLHPLRLRGGDVAEAAGVTDNLPDKSVLGDLQEYTGGEENSNAIDPPVASQWLSSALDCVRIRMVMPDKASQSWRGDSFKPLFAHQVFGQHEKIVGYQSPKVELLYAADSLVPAISFSHAGTASPDEANCTDVVGCIKTHAPADYINATRLPKYVDLIRGNFEPPGELVGDYSEYELGHDEAYLKRTREECAAEHVKYEAYLWKAGSTLHNGANQTKEEGDAELEAKAGQDLVKRSQSLAMWLVERASYIDLSDPNWSCIFLYERLDGALKNNTPPSIMPEFHLVGFTTLYRKPIAGLTDKELSELTPLRDDIKNKSGMVRLMVSQFVILRPYARRGHGTKLLRLVYKLARRDKSVLDVAVEDPNDAFKALRQHCDAAELRDMNLLESLKSANPPWAEIQNHTKLSMVQLFALAEAIGCEAGRAGVRKSEEKEEYSSLFGVPVDLEMVYERASVLGFTRTEIDDILHAIRAEDLEGVQGPQDGARRLLSGVYMAVVADLAQAEGLSDEEVDALLEKVDTPALLEAGSPRDVARIVLPLINKVKNTSGRTVQAEASK